MDPSTLISDMQDRSTWRTLCHDVVGRFEDLRVEALEHKRAVRRVIQPPSNLSAWRCDSCFRVCSSRFGLHANSSMTSDPSFRWRIPYHVCLSVCLCVSVCQSVSLTPPGVATVIRN